MADRAEEMTFEEALARLEEIVRQLEEGQLGLSESLACYEEGVQHLKHCHRALELSEQKILLLTGVDVEGQPIVQPFDEQAMTLEEKRQARSRRRSHAGPRRADSLGDERGDVDTQPGLF